MIKYFGDFWTNIYGDESPNSELIEALNKSFTNQELQIVAFIRHINKALSRQTVEEAINFKNKQVIYDEDALNDQHYIFDGTISFDGSKLFSSKPSNVFRLKLPSDVAMPPFIADDPVDPTIVLQMGIDYAYNDGYIYMREDIREKGFPMSFDTSIPPKETLSLWFLNCQGMVNTVQRLFGNPIKAASFNNRDLINVYWDMLVEGCSDRNLRRLLCVITDTDYVRTGGTVRDIFTENGRYVVEINNNFYSSPEAAGVLVSIGDEVDEGQMIFGNAAVYNPEDEMPADVFPILHLSEAMIGADIPGGVSIENKDTDIPGLRETLLMENVSLDAVDALVSGDPAYIVSTSDGYELIQYAEEPYTEYEMVRILEALPFRGKQENIQDFLDNINEIAIARGKTILDILIDTNEGAPPSQLNLFEQYRKNLFGTNAVFISVKTELAPDGMDPTVPLSFLKRVLNAGTAVLTFFESESIVEYSLDAVSDSVEVFLVPDALIGYDGYSSADSFNSVSDEVKVG